MRITGDVRSTVFYLVAVIFVIHGHMNRSELEGTYSRAVQ